MFKEQSRPSAARGSGVFWAWAMFLAVSLATMIAIPLTGR